jgi:hypothetical protein
MSDLLNPYQQALVNMTAACAGLRDAAARLQAASLMPGANDAGADKIVEACRAVLLDALAIAPGLRDVLVVPALPARR